MFMMRRIEDKLRCPKCGFEKPVAQGHYIPATGKTIRYLRICPKCTTKREVMPAKIDY